jgi:formylglycine-generating enzyme required for sulfatase activity
MGCVPQDADNCARRELPRHRVRITRAFEMTATEVTVREYDAFGAATRLRTPRQPSWNTGDRQPLVNVTWIEARAFCQWAGGRLPTEAEWEYAARGGRGDTLYPWGDQFDPALANAESIAGRKADPYTGAAPVASFPPNGFGLYDMVGNLWEWVNDSYVETYYAQSPEADPPGPPENEFRVIRGGSWDSDPKRLSLSFRSRLSAVGRYNLYVGFRCVR